MDLFRVVPPAIEERHHGFRENTGPQHPPVNAKPIAYFFMFFTMEFLHHIVRETNKYQINLITEKIFFFDFQFRFYKIYRSIASFQKNVHVRQMSNGN